MRFFITALICALFAGCASTPKPSLTSVEIEEIKPRYIKEEQFKRINEYLTGTENVGDRVIFRTDPKSRDGYYFTLILDEDVRKLPKGTVIVGEFYTPTSVEKQTHTFTFTKKRPKTKEIFIGLTGADWPADIAPQIAPAAWHFTIQDANGNTLGSKKSYLWEL